MEKIDCTSIIFKISQRYHEIHIHFILDVKLGFTDTDSFLYLIKCEENIYSKLAQLDPDGEFLDFSNYPSTHPNYSMKNHLVPGMKDFKLI